MLFSDKRIKSVCDVYSQPPLSQFFFLDVSIYERVIDYGLCCLIVLLSYQIPFSSSSSQIKRKSFMDSIRRSITFGEADKKRKEFKQKGVNNSQMEQPLLNLSNSSDDVKRHSYHGSSSYEKSSFEDSPVDGVEVRRAFINNKYDTRWLSLNIFTCWCAIGLFFLN